MTASKLVQGWPEEREVVAPEERGVVARQSDSDHREVRVLFSEGLLSLLVRLGIGFMTSSAIVRRSLLLRSHACRKRVKLS